MKYMMRMLNRVLPDCEQVAQLASHSLDQSLPWQRHVGMRLHLMACIYCRRNLRQLRMLRTLARRVDGAAASAVIDGNSLSAQARRHIARSLSEAGREPDE
jgi:hypothetical protein